MEHCWRITKYNPNLRDENGNYTKDEWTAISDVGKKYSGEVFIMDQYLTVEDKYIIAIINIMDSAEIPCLEVKRLNKWEHEFEFEEYYTDNMLNLYRTVKNGDRFHKDKLVDLCKLLLRENIGCQLWFESNMYVHFGYDYYMYVGINSDCHDALEGIRNLGLFVEKFESPYLNIDKYDDEERS
jgi:hypothetical protein